jgi:hypothetical protein
MNDDFYNCVSIEENSEVIRVTIVAATETIFEIPHSASYHLEIMADIGAIIAPIMKLDIDHQEWGDGNIESRDATPADIAAINQFKRKYAGRVTSVEGDII